MLCLIYTISRVFCLVQKMIFQLRFAFNEIDCVTIFGVFRNSKCFWCECLCVKPQMLKNLPQELSIIKKCIMAPNTEFEFNEPAISTILTWWLGFQTLAYLANKTVRKDEKIIKNYIRLKRSFPRWKFQRTVIDYMEFDLLFFVHVLCIRKDTYWLSPP